MKQCPYCTVDTAGNHEPGCILNNHLKNLPFTKGEQNGPVGWICPVCGKGLSPFATECGCVQPVQATITDNSGHKISFT